MTRIGRPARPQPTTGENRDRPQIHDLHPDAALQVLDCASDPQGAVIVEPGAGNGALTLPMLAAGNRVWAFERDPTRAQALAKRAKTALDDGRLQLFPHDLAGRLPEPSEPWVVIGNPPFNLTASLVRRWLLHGPRAMTLVLQKEAADKLCGAPGAHTRSSVLARAAGAPHRALILPREATSPPARVDLAVWCWHRAVGGPDAEQLLRLDALLEKAFAGPHMVKEALRGVLTSEQIRRQSSERGFAPTAHPRTLAPADWLSILRYAG